MEALEKLGRKLVELLSEGLGLCPTRFNHYFEDGAMTSMRLNMYPPCPEPSLAIGLRAHTDPHLLTILHQDNVVGLQVQVAGEWITVKPRPDCFVVNIGDLFQVLRSFHPTSVHSFCFQRTPASTVVQWSIEEWQPLLIMRQLQTT